MKAVKIAQPQRQIWIFELVRTNPLSSNILRGWLDNKKEKLLISKNVECNVNLIYIIHK